MADMFKKTIHVSFADIETGKVFAVSDMMPDQLPESFEARTTMRLNNDSWEVVAAIPVNSCEFIKSGELKLVLRKVVTQTINPDDVLFSMPTISNELPTIDSGSTKLHKKVFEIHEDHWRQIDIIPQSKLDLIAENFTAIKKIYKENSIQLGDSVGFKTLHIRTGLDAPFEDQRDELLTLLNDLNTKLVYDGVAFEGIEGLIEGGFAVNIGEDMVLYGLEQDNIVQCLALQALSQESFDKGLDKMVKVLIKHDLCLVNWCMMRIYKDITAGEN